MRETAAEQQDEMSDPEVQPRSSSLPLTLEQYKAVQKYKVPKYRHHITRLPEHIQRLYYEAERREVYTMEVVYAMMKRAPRGSQPKDQLVYKSLMAYACKRPCGTYPGGRVRARGCNFWCCAPYR